VCDTLLKEDEKMLRVPIPKNMNLVSSNLHAFFEWYKKQALKQPGYGSKRKPSRKS
jgi:hypothetical protein